MNKQIPIKEIIDFLGSDIIRVYGEIENILIKYFKPSESVDLFTLDWIGSSKQNKQKIAEKSKATVIICDSSVSYTELIKRQNKVLIQVNNPKRAVALIADQFFIKKPSPGINSTSFIDPDAKIASSAYIGANCSIGKCKIGNQTRIFSNVTIYDQVTIGNNVVIQAGAVVGTDGLGCERKEDGTLVKFSHLGGVLIGNNVEIGANCQIAKGALSDTIIGDGTKINGLCFIAHNCIIGKNVWITGSAMLAGSVIVEDNATIYSGAIIREQRTIGKGAIIGMGSVVTKNVPEKEIWIGNPAKKIKK